MKITIVGAGNVGATAAKVIADRNLAQEIVLLDIVEGMARGKALDIAQSASLSGFETQIAGTDSYEKTKDSHIVIITAGMARKPGMSRNDLAHCNARIVRGAVAESIKQSPKCIILIVTNPLDIMAQLALDESGFPKHRIMGMAGMLDTSRFRYFVAQELGVLPREVDAMVLGGHGELMVPCISLATVKGVALTSLLSEGNLEAIVKRTRDGGAEIVNFLKTGSAYYAPGEAIAEMVSAIAKGEGQVLPCTAYLEGEYGLTGVYCGVPCTLGPQGITEIKEIPLSEQDLRTLRASADMVKEQYRQLLETINEES